MPQAREGTPKRLRQVFRLRVCAQPDPPSRRRLQVHLGQAATVAFRIKRPIGGYQDENRSATRYGGASAAAFHRLPY